MVTIWKNIGVVRGAAILCVVISHSTLCFRNIKASIDGGPLAQYELIERIVLTLGVTLPIASIAGFMIASGFIMCRFSSSWSAALASFRSIGLRYLSWTFGGFLAIAAITRKLSFIDIVDKMRSYFGPFPAYWFFVSLLLFTLLTPVLIQLAKRRPFYLLGSFIALEVLRAYLFYGCAGAGPAYLVPLQGSYFILGCLLSQYSGVIVPRLIPFRNHILACALVFLALAFLETNYWWEVGGAPVGQTISADRMSVRLYAIMIVTWLILRETRPSPFASFLNKVGMKSLSIFLCFDFFIWLSSAVLWHLSAIFGDLGAYHMPTTPSYMVHPAWIVFYFGVGIAGPLATVSLVERFAGKRSRIFLFG